MVARTSIFALEASENTSSQSGCVFRAGIFHWPEALGRSKPRTCRLARLSFSTITKCPLTKLDFVTPASAASASKTSNVFGVILNDKYFVLLCCTMSHVLSLLCTTVCDDFPLSVNYHYRGGGRLMDWRIPVCFPCYFRTQSVTLAQRMVSHEK